MDSSSVRKPAVAGTFYPEDGAELHEMVQRFLREGHAASTPPRAVIAPHAGYIYSGPIAGSAFSGWQALREKIQRVVIAGPSHRLAFEGIATPGVKYFATPLGLVEVDREAIKKLSALPQVIESEAAHRHEHSIETHLPFLQETVAEFHIVPLLIGDASPIEIAQVFTVFWNDPGTVFSISSDLSHYLPYDKAVELDALTTRAIVENHPHDISPEQACGRLAILGLMRLMDRHGLRATALDVRNSGDTAGDHSRVVGYGAYAFS